MIGVGFHVVKVMLYFATFKNVLKVGHKIIHIKTCYFNSRFGFIVIVTGFLSESQQNVHFGNFF